MTVTSWEEDILDFMIPHLLKGCNYPFALKVVYVDNRGQPISGTTMESKLLKLKGEGVIDEFKEIDYNLNAIERLYKKVFVEGDFDKTYSIGDDGKKKFTTSVHNGKGFLSYWQSLEDCLAKTEYCVHMDIDICMFTASNYSWIAQGTALLDMFDDIAVVSPIGSPYRPGTYTSKEQRAESREQRAESIFTY